MRRDHSRGRRFGVVDRHLQPEPLQLAGGPLLLDMLGPDGPTLLVAAAARGGSSGV